MRKFYVNDFKFLKGETLILNMKRKPVILKRMKKFLPLLILIAAGFGAFAQDPQFSQYYQAPLYLNPGFTGITPQQRLVFNHRLQWPSLPQAFSTYALSYDIFVNELRSGFGFLFTTDKMGSAGWRTTTASLLYSYKVKLTEKIVFSPGLSFGYGTNGLDRSKLVLGDGLEYDGISLDPELNKLGRQSYFDFGSGFLLYSKSLWLGASFMHMNRPNLSVLNEVSRLGMKTAIHGGIKTKFKQQFTHQGKSILFNSFLYLSHARQHVYPIGFRIKLPYRSNLRRSMV